jgi:aminopeptidase N
VRWDSGQQYAIGLIFELIAAFRRGAPLQLDPGLESAFTATLNNADADPAFAAEALTLPAESLIADQMETADVEAIHAAREFLRAELARATNETLLATYNRLDQDTEYAIDGLSIGRRALKNVSLAYLAVAGQAGIELAYTQYKARRNMTDVLAALGVLCATDSPERTEALDDFYHRWRRDELVLDKWFALQALSPLPGTLAAVETLSRHPDFDLRNPNRVRSLVGNFASNQVRFHDASGAGYRFLAEKVMALDPLNAQVAARMVTPLGAWRRHDPARQALMQEALRSILSVPGLSRNTYEQVSKSLG